MGWIHQLGLGKDVWPACEISWTVKWLPRNSCRCFFLELFFSEILLFLRWWSMWMLILTGVLSSVSTVYPSVSQCLSLSINTNLFLYFCTYCLGKSMTSSFSETWRYLTFEKLLINVWIWCIILDAFALKNVLCINNWDSLCFNIHLSIQCFFSLLDLLLYHLNF